MSEQLTMLGSVPDLPPAGPGEARHPLDAYYTPQALAVACVRALGLTRPEHHPGPVLEPHAGGGAFVRALRHHGREVVALDVNQHAPGLRLAQSSAVVDFLDTGGVHAAIGDLPARYDCADGTPRRFPWIVGNPPYRDAEAHTRQALALGVRVAFVLRLAFLESIERSRFWRDHPPRIVWVLQERPSFLQGGNQTDSSAYALFMWDQSPRLAWRATAPWLRWMSWRGRASIAAAQRRKAVRHG